MIIEEVIKLGKMRFVLSKPRLAFLKKQIS